MYSGRVFLRLLGVVLLLSWATSLNAQLNHGDMEGTATDPQGGVIPGVNVVITSVGTNVSQTTKTNSAGYYRVVDLVPGKYRARFEAQGFQPVDVSEIQVSPAIITRIDARLELGQTLQSVEVQATMPLLQTSATNISDTVESKTITEVPINGRDLQNLLYLTPGVNQVAGPPGTLFGFNSQFGSFPDPTHQEGSTVAVDGGQPGDNAWFLDGNLNMSSFAENVAVNPSPDSVEEFQTISNAFSAEYGRTGGAVFSTTLKSGTNKLHGDLFEFLRNNKIAARNPFTSFDALGNSVPQNIVQFNDFGGTLGGPVYIPHLYDGRNKTFFFFSLDVSRLREKGRQKFTVPTPLERQADFSEDPEVVQSGLWNPYSTIGPATDGTFARSAFGTPITPQGCTGMIVPAAGGGTTALEPTSASCNFSTQIPSNLLDPTAAFFTNSFPAPNFFDSLVGCPVAAGGQFRICNNFLGTVGSSQDQKNWSIKVDHQASAKSKFFGEWLYNPVNYRNYKFPWTGPTAPLNSVGFGAQYPIDLLNHIVALGHTFFFSPTMVNEFRASFTRQSLSTSPQMPFPESISAQSDVQKVLAPIRIPLDPFFPTPNFNVTPVAAGLPTGGASISFGPQPWTNMFTASEAYTILDNVTDVIGKHTLKIGFMYRLNHTAFLTGFPTILNFSGSLVQNPTTGLGASGLAQFMLGATGTGGRNSATGVMWKPYERWRDYAWYVQDDFHIKPNFTLNIGVRYELNGLFKTRTPGTNFCLKCPNPLTGLPGIVTFQGDKNFPGPDIASPNTNSVAPRINFSWAPFPDRKTVFRWGYDIFYSNAIDTVNAPGQGAANSPGYNQEFDFNRSFFPNQCASFTTECVAFPLGDTTTDKTLLAGLPQPFPSFPAAQGNPLLGIGLLQFFTPPSRDPMVQKWNFQIQRQLPGDMMLTVGYVGTHGTHLAGETFRQFNFVHTKDLVKFRGSIGEVIPITDVYSGFTAQQLEKVYGSSSLPRNVLLKDFPFFGALSTLQNNTAFDGTSIYHGMNVKLQKRYSHGLNFLVAYTVSKKITNASTNIGGAGSVNPISFGSTKSGLIGGRGGALAWSNGGIGGAFQDFDNRNGDRSIAFDDVPQILNIVATYELPFGRARRFVPGTSGVIDQFISGWRITPSFNAQSGVPLSVSGPCDDVTCRPNLIGDPVVEGGRNKKAQQFINPAAFEPAFGSDPNFLANFDPNDPRAVKFGTAGARLPGLRSPGFWNLDMAVDKDFHVTENVRISLRWELFNALNHQNLGLPNTGFCLPPGPNGQTDLLRQAGCQFGRITNVAIDPRAQQFSLKLIF